MNNHVEEYFFKEGCFIEEWLNSENDAELSVAQVRVEPGVTTHLHSLTETVERYVILHGSARVMVGEEQWHVTAKDVVTIPAGTPQRIQNLEQTDLVFLAICTPRFQPENYHDLSNAFGS